MKLEAFLRKLDKIITKIGLSLKQNCQISSEKPNNNIKEINKSFKIIIASTTPSTRARVIKHSTTTTTTQLRGATITSSGAASATVS